MSPRLRPAAAAGLTAALALLAGGVAAPAASAAPSAAPSASPSASPSTSAAPSAGARATVRSDSTLPRIPLSRFGAGRTHVADDHGIALGGTGSDLYPAGKPGEFWAVTDRGPNGQIKVDGDKRRTFPTPGFTPTIVRLQVRGAKLTVLKALPLRGTDGTVISGRSNQEGHDETPYDWNAQHRVAYDPGGLDTEGLVRAADGSFWLTDEYSPSIVHVAPGGRILARYVPYGLHLKGAPYPVKAVLPTVLLDRAGNRGIESLALAPDGRTAYAALQSPLSLPGEDAGEASRNVRLLRFDLRTHETTAEYVYRFEDVTGFDPGADGDESEMKISGLAALDAHRLLVDERTDDVTKLYVADLRHATNVRGTFADDPHARPSLEQADLAAKRVTPVAKSLALDVTAAVPSAPTKIEGVAVLGPRTVALANDNDFGMTDGPDAFDANGRLRDSGLQSRLLVLHLSRAL